MEKKQIEIIGSILIVMFFLIMLFRFLSSKNTAVKNVLTPSPFPTSSVNYNPSGQILPKKNPDPLFVSPTGQANGPSNAPAGGYEPDTAPGVAVEEEEKYQFENNPDIYLANKTPFSTAEFSIKSGYRKTYPGHLYFTVSLANSSNDKSKNEFMAWLKSLGLSDAKIQTLDIEYQ